jgi:nucleotide-binding universal stress UspA family protein
LAKRIGAKVTVLTVLPPFHTLTTDAQMIEDTPAEYKARMQKHGEKTLGAATHAAQLAGIECKTVQVDHEHPYQAIVDTAKSKGTAFPRSSSAARRSRSSRIARFQCSSIDELV